MSENTERQRPHGTVLDGAGNKKGQIQDYPETGLKYAYGGDAGNRTPDTTDMSRML